MSQRGRQKYFKQSTNHFSNFWALSADGQVTQKRRVFPRPEGPLAEGTKVVVRTLPVGLEMAVLAAVEDRRLIRQWGEICFEAFPVGCGDCLGTAHKINEILASG